MARSINQVILMGNLTRDPELRQTTNGSAVCSFSLAMNRSYKDKNDQWVEDTDYVDVTAWAGLGERVAQYLSKGRRCLVQGQLRSRSWEQDGQKRNKLEVLANEVTFLDAREDGAPQAAAAKPSTSQGGKKDDVVIEDISDEPINLDDIPF